MELADKLVEIFINRTDVFARKGETWFPERNRDTKEDIPLQKVDIVSHLYGFYENKRIGAYSPTPEGQTKWVVIDVDNKEEDTIKHTENLVNLRKLQKYLLEEHSVVAFIELSYSGWGYHLWIFFNGLVNAARARKFMLECIDKAALKREQYDFICPKKDSIGMGQYGNLIGLPLFGCQNGKTTTTFIDYPDQMSVLDEILSNRISEDILPVIEPVSERKHIVAREVTDIEFPEGDIEANLMECIAIQESLRDANQFKEPTWQAILSNLVVFGEPLLLFAHKVSNGHVNYSVHETQAKWVQKLSDYEKGMQPYRCDTVKEKGWTCPLLGQCPCKFIHQAVHLPAYHTLKELRDNGELHRQRANGQGLYLMEKTYDLTISHAEKISQFAVLAYEEKERSFFVVPKTTLDEPSALKWLKFLEEDQPSCCYEDGNLWLFSAEKRTGTVWVASYNKVCKQLELHKSIITKPQIDKDKKLYMPLSNTIGGKLNGKVRQHIGRSE